MKRPILHPRYDKSEPTVESELHRLRHAYRRALEEKREPARTE